MNISYEVVTAKDRKFVAVVNEEDRTISLGDYIYGSEGWISLCGETITIFLGTEDKTGVEMRKAIFLALSHFPPPAATTFPSGEEVDP